jgi:SAM-dependent methyltransferase
LINKGFRPLGIDPARNVVKPLLKKGFPIINNYFKAEVAEKIAKKFGKFDMVFSSNTLAHIEDMSDVFSGIKKILKPDGFIMFEVHYLANLIREIQYDMIYHEHQYYYSALSVKKFVESHGLELFNVKLIPNIHAGSIRFYIQFKKTGKNLVSKSVAKIISEEKKLKLDDVSAFESFSKRITQTREKLLNKLNEIKKSGKRIAGYGASGRGTIIMNYCKIGRNYIDYVADDAPSRQNLFTPGTHVPTVSSKILTAKNRPDFLLLFAWSFFEEIKKRNIKYINSGGKFILPLPEVTTI